MMKIEVQDYNYHSDDTVEKIEKPMEEPVQGISIQVDNGRIHVYVNDIEVYSNMSLAEGQIDIDFQ